MKKINNMNMYFLKKIYKVPTGCQNFIFSVLIYKKDSDEFVA